MVVREEADGGHSADVLFTDDCGVWWCGHVLRKDKNLSIGKTPQEDVNGM